MSSELHDSFAEHPGVAFAFLKSFGSGQSPLFVENLVVEISSKILETAFSILELIPKVAVVIPGSATFLFFRLQTVKDGNTLLDSQSMIITTTVAIWC